MGEKRLDSLTSWRFLAAFLVVLYHFAPSSLKRVPVVGETIHLGYLGVVFFFVLSGFVLVAVYGSRAKERRVGRESFYLARFARIYPIYAVSLLAWLLFFAYPILRSHTDLQPLREMAIPLALRLTMLSAWIPGYALPLNGQAWTISVEAFFYALFPFLLGPLLRAQPTARRWMVVAVNALCITIPTVIHLFRPSEASGSVYQSAAYFPLLHLGSFLVGCEAGLIYLDGRARTPVGRRRLGLAAAGALATFSLSIAFYHFVPREVQHNGLLAIPFAAAILWLAENDARLAPLRLPVLVSLGEASYGLYILQQPVHDAMLTVADRLHLVQPRESMAFLGAYLVGLVAIALFGHKFFEIPMRRWLRAKLEPKRPVEHWMVDVEARPQPAENRE